MTIAIIKNNASEGPGTIAQYLDSAGKPYRVFEPGEALDAGYDAFVVLGGPMAVYESLENSAIKSVLGLMESAVKDGKPVLGVCLGAQMLAHVLGARVYKGPAGQEVGWMDVTLTADAGQDKVFGAIASGLPDGSTLRVFQWHGDTFGLPSGATRLASSAKYENQSFRYGGAYALQFHLEVNAALVKGWFGLTEQYAEMARTTESVFPAYHERAKAFYKGFFGN